MGFQQPNAFTVIRWAASHRDSGGVRLARPFGAKVDGPCPDPVPNFHVLYGDVGRGIAEFAAPGIAMLNYAFKPDGAVDSRSGIIEGIRFDQIIHFDSLTDTVCAYCGDQRRAAGTVAG